MLLGPVPYTQKFLISACLILDDNCKVTELSVLAMDRFNIH